MFPLSLPRIFGTVHCDSDAPTSRAASTINTVKSAISVPESELKRWRRSFDANAQTVVEGQKCVASPTQSIHTSLLIPTRVLPII